MALTESKRPVGFIWFFLFFLLRDFLIKLKVKYELDEKIQEIWLHAECAIWNSSIYIKDNQVYGISHCFATSNNSVSVQTHKCFQL